MNWFSWFSSANAVSTGNTASIENSANVANADNIVNATNTANTILKSPLLFQWIVKGQVPSRDVFRFLAMRYNKKMKKNESYSNGSYSHWKLLNADI